jgi:predicted O-methyltransferase YrrM
MRTIRSYKIIFANNKESVAVNGLSLACDGTWRDAVQSNNGKYDLAFIDVDEENVAHLEEMLEQDDNVLSYLRMDG